MADAGEPCCGHDHVGGDELWLSIDDMVDLVRAVTWDTVREQLALSRAEVERGPGELSAAGRARIRRNFGQFRDEREGQGDEPAPGPRHLAEARRERRWGGR